MGTLDDERGKQGQANYRELGRQWGQTFGSAMVIGVSCPTMTALAKLCYERSSAKGFTNATSLDSDEQQMLFLAKLMLVVSECGEVAEAARKPELRDSIPEEFADVIIRVLDMCGAMGIDIGLAVAQKLERNASRPHLHGKTI